MYWPILLFLASQPTWTLTVGGDIMLNGIKPGTGPLKAVAPWFQGSSIAYANLEIPLTDAKTATKKKTAAELKAKTQFILKASPLHAAHIQGVGIKVVSLGTNHGMDYGWKGLSQMRELLDRKGILYSGAGANSEDAQKMVVLTTPDGIKVGFVSYLALVGAKGIGHCTPATSTSPGVASLAFGGSVGKEKKEWLKNRVAALKQDCDLLALNERHSRRPTRYRSGARGSMRAQIS